jgi:hypothetical protein
MNKKQSDLARLRAIEARLPKTAAEKAKEER